VHGRGTNARGLIGTSMPLPFMWPATLSIALSITSGVMLASISLAICLARFLLIFLPFVLASKPE
jgi:cellobiose-specific phosphotransferase system component IIC